MEFDYIAFILLLLYTFLFILEAKQLIEIFYIKNKKTNYRNGIIFSLTWVSIFRIFLWIKVMIPTELPEVFLSVIFELPIWLNFVGLSLLAVFYANALYQGYFGNTPWRICVIVNIIFLFFYIAIGCMDSLATTTLDQKIVFGFYAAYSIIIHTFTAASVGYYGYYFVHNQIQAYRNWILPRPIEIFSAVNWLIVICSLSRSILVAIFAIPTVDSALRPNVEYNGEHEVTSLTVLFFMFFTEWVPNYSMLYLTWRSSSPHSANMYDPLLAGHPVSPVRKRKSRRSKKRKPLPTFPPLESNSSPGTDDEGSGQQSQSLLSAMESNHNTNPDISMRSYLDGFPSEQAMEDQQQSRQTDSDLYRFATSFWSWLSWWRPSSTSADGGPTGAYSSMFSLIGDDYDDFSEADDPRYSYISGRTSSFEDDAMVKIIFDENFRYRNSSESMYRYEEDDEEDENGMGRSDSAYRKQYDFGLTAEEIQQVTMESDEVVQQDRLDRHTRDSMVVNRSSLDVKQVNKIAAIMKDYDPSKDPNVIVSKDPVTGKTLYSSRPMQHNNNHHGPSMIEDGITDNMIDEKKHSKPISSSPASSNGGGSSGRLNFRKRFQHGNNNNNGSGKSAGSGGSGSGKSNKKSGKDSNDNNNTNANNNWLVSALYRQTPWSATPQPPLPPPTSSPSLDHSYTTNQSPFAHPSSVTASTATSNTESNTDLFSASTTNPNVYNPIVSNPTSSLAVAAVEVEPPSSSSSSSSPINTYSYPSTATSMAEEEEAENQFIFLQEHEEENNIPPPPPTGSPSMSSNDMLPVNQSMESLGSTNSQGRKNRRSDSESGRMLGNTGRIRSSSSMGNLRLLHLQPSDVQLPILPMSEEKQDHQTTSQASMQLGKPKYSDTVGPRDILHYQMKSAMQ